MNSIGRELFLANILSIPGRIDFLASSHLCQKVCVSERKRVKEGIRSYFTFFHTFLLELFRTHSLEDLLKSFNWQSLVYSLYFFIISCSKKKKDLMKKKIEQNFVSINDKYI